MKITIRLEKVEESGFDEVNILHNKLINGMSGHLCTLGEIEEILRVLAGVFNLETDV